MITENVKEHKLLMDDSITFANVVEAHAARQKAFEELERQHEFRQRQDLEAVKSCLGLILYDRERQRLKACQVVQSGDWLSEQEQYNHWIDPSDKASRLLWLQGIPGAGKSPGIHFLQGPIVADFSRFKAKHSCPPRLLIISQIGAIQRYLLSWTTNPEKAFPRSACCTLSFGR